MRGRTDWWIRDVPESVMRWLRWLFGFVLVLATWSLLTHDHTGLDLRHNTPPIETCLPMPQCAPWASVTHPCCKEHR